MTKASGDEKSSDGLEIISIGKIYSGPWDKKYWSSSRGKERYPYPSGYNAIRTRNNITYKMEILEGPKGPLFKISSTDGKSCSGQTPDMAWEYFQKKSPSQMKLWHGKRFSCKIDGVEFFGFKNAFVQRLLRELVANVSETPAQSLHIEKSQPRECAESTTYTDPPRVTKKRSRKEKVINIKSVRVNAVQKVTLKEEKNHNSDTVKFEETNFSTSDETSGSHDSLQTIPTPLNLEKTLVSENLQTVQEVDISAPDSFDSPSDDLSTKISSEAVYNVKKDITETHIEEDTALSIPNSYSEKNEFDSVGQEIAKSMMNVLLPRALPLLKTFSRKRKKNLKSSKNSQFGEENNKIEPLNDDVASIVIEHTEIDKMDLLNSQLVVQNVGDTDSFVPDTFDNYNNDFRQCLSTQLGCFSEDICPKSNEISHSKLENFEANSHSLAKEDINEQNIVFENTQSHFHEIKEPKQVSYSKAETNLDHNKLIGSYNHNKHISMVLLRINGNYIHICTLCGINEDEEKTLFLYKAPINGENMGSPSFIGHVSLIFPSRKYVKLEKSCLQFTPDAKYLVMLNNIKTPYCRLCKADLYEENSIKIVEVKEGFVSVVTKLKTSKSVRCILVYEPSFLIASEDNGKVYLWLMNSNWSAKTEEWYLPTSDSPVELKNIPKSKGLILGHNGFGEFLLWDICKRVLVSKFCSTSTLIQRFVPVSYFKWRRKDLVCGNTDMVVFVNEIMDSTRKCFSVMNVNEEDNDDVAIWVLISSNMETNMCTDWRLGLLVKNKVIMGSSLDSRAVTVGGLFGNGIIGRDDGFVYECDLSRGVNLGSFHQFKGGSVSCIATEDSGGGAFAIASNGGELRIYLHS